MLTENDLRTALAEQDEVIAWLAEQNINYHAPKGTWLVKAAS